MNLPERVAQAAQDHIALLNTRLPGLMDSYYITGSAVLGDYREGISDVDFAVLLRAQPGAAALNELKRIHRELRQKHPQAPLDGVYITEADLTEPAGATCPRFNHGRFAGMKAFDTGSAEAWVLKQHGVCLAGQEALLFPYEADTEALLRHTRSNLDTYWRKWAKDSSNPLSPRFYSLFGQAGLEWGVLGISRLYYTFCEKDVISKAGAGEYALQNVPACWRGVLRDALLRRMLGGSPQYLSLLLRRKHALLYVQYMIAECIRQYEAGMQ